jgi:hypothetical protein
MGRMCKYILTICLVMAVGGPAGAKKPRRHKSTHAAAQAAPAKHDVDRADVPPKVDSASEFQKAKAELDDLRTPTRDTPTEFLENQASDGESPFHKK